VGGAEGEGGEGQGGEGVRWVRRKGDSWVGGGGSAIDCNVGNLCTAKKSMYQVL